MTMQKKHEEIVERMKRTIAHWKGLHSDLQLEANEISQARDDAVTELEALKVNLQINIETVTSENDALTSECERLKQQLRAEATRTAELAEEVTRRDKTIEDLKSKLAVDGANESSQHLIEDVCIGK